MVSYSKLRSSLFLTALAQSTHHSLGKNVRYAIAIIRRCRAIILYGPSMHMLSFMAPMLEALLIGLGRMTARGTLVIARQE